MSIYNLYHTRYGKAYVGDSYDLLESLDNESVDLVLTSMPSFTIVKECGNRYHDKYVDWMLRVLKPTGSFVFGFDNVYSQPLYNYYTLVRLCDVCGFNFVKDFFWCSSTKLLSSNGYVNTVWWLSKTKLKNTKIKNTRSNLLQLDSTSSDLEYFKFCKNFGVKKSFTTFPVEIALFFINLLTEPKNVVIDIFAKSNTTGKAAENSKRKWISCDLNKSCVISSAFRFFTLSENTLSNKVLFDNLNSSGSLPVFIPT